MPHARNSQTTVNPDAFSIFSKTNFNSCDDDESVSLWKARQVELTHHIAHAANCACAVLNSENSLSSHKFKLAHSVSSSTFNKLSPTCSIDLHNPFLTSMRNNRRAVQSTHNHDSSRCRRKKSWHAARNEYFPQYFWATRRRPLLVGVLLQFFWIRNYCSASINRVIVRFSSLSDRRSSSILLIECSTVV